MLLTEYNEEEIMERERQKARKEAAKQERERIVTRMLKKGGMSVSYISKMTDMPEEAVLHLAETLGIVL